MDKKITGWFIFGWAGLLIFAGLWILSINRPRELQSDLDSALADNVSAKVRIAELEKTVGESQGTVSQLIDQLARERANYSRLASENSRQRAIIESIGKELSDSESAVNAIDGLNDQARKIITECLAGLGK